MSLGKVAAVSFCVILFSSLVLAQDSTYVPSYKFKPGKEIVAVYVGSSHCGPCKTPEFKKSLQHMVVRAADEAQQSGAGFWALGIAADMDITAGYDFLKASGQFDEIAIGRDWHNTAITRYVLLDEFSMPATPQVILLEREVEQDGIGIKILGEKILLRLVGQGEIDKVLAEKKPLDQFKTFKGMLIEQTSAK